MVARTEGAGGSWRKCGAAHTPRHSGGSVSQTLTENDVRSRSLGVGTGQSAPSSSNDGVVSLPLSTMPLGVSIHEEELVVTFPDAVQVLSLPSLRMQASWSTRSRDRMSCPVTATRHAEAARYVGILGNSTAFAWSRSDRDIFSTSKSAAGEHPTKVKLSSSVHSVLTHDDVSESILVHTDGSVSLLTSALEQVSITKASSLDTRSNKRSRMRIAKHAELFSVHDGGKAQGVEKTEATSAPSTGSSKVKKAVVAVVSACENGELLLDLFDVYQSQVAAAQNTADSSASGVESRAQPSTPESVTTLKHSAIVRLSSLANSDHSQAKHASELVSFALDMNSRTLSLLWSTRTWQVFRFPSGAVATKTDFDTTRVFSQKPILVHSSRLALCIDSGAYTRFVGPYLAVAGVFSRPGAALLPPSQRTVTSLTFWNVEFGSVQHTVALDASQVLESPSATAGELAPALLPALLAAAGTNGKHRGKNGKNGSVLPHDLIDALKHVDAQHMDEAKEANSREVCVRHLAVSADSMTIVATTNRGLSLINVPEELRQAPESEAGEENFRAPSLRQSLGSMKRSRSFLDVSGSVDERPSKRLKPSSEEAKESPRPKNGRAKNGHRHEALLLSQLAHASPHLASLSSHEWQIVNELIQCASSGKSGKSPKKRKTDCALSEEKFKKRLVNVLTPSAFGDASVRQSMSHVSDALLMCIVDICLASRFFASLSVVVETGRLLSEQCGERLVDALVEHGQRDVLGRCVRHIADLPEDAMVRVLCFALGDGDVDVEALREDALILAVLSSSFNDHFMRASLQRHLPVEQAVRLLSLLDSLFPRSPSRKTSPSHQASLLAAGSPSSSSRSPNSKRRRSKAPVDDAVSNSPMSDDEAAEAPVSPVFQVEAGDTDESARRESSVPLTVVMSWCSLLLAAHFTSLVQSPPAVAVLSKVYARVHSRIFSARQMHSLKFSLERLQTKRKVLAQASIRRKSGGGIRARGLPRYSVTSLYY